MLYDWFIAVETALTSKLCATNPYKLVIIIFMLQNGEVPYDWLRHVRVV